MLGGLLFTTPIYERAMQIGLGSQLRTARRPISTMNHTNRFALHSIHVTNTSCIPGQPVDVTSASAVQCPLCHVADDFILSRSPVRRTCRSYKSPMFLKKISQLTFSDIRREIFSKCFSHDVALASKEALLCLFPESAP